MQRIRNTGITLAGLALFAVVGSVMAGCGHKEEAAPPGYYTGPMKPKGAPNVKGGGMPAADDSGGQAQRK